MTMKARLALCALPLLVFLLPAGAQAADGMTGNATAGKTEYFEHGCYSCHGYNGGGRVTLTGKPAGTLANETVFLSFLRMRGDENPLLPSSEMPHFAVSSLPDKQAKDIYAFIRTFKPDDPSLDSVPVLKSILQEVESRDPAKP